MIKEQISLYFQSGSSDKEYHTQLIEEGNGFVVNFQYGRRGSALKAGTKTKEEVTLEEATKIYTKLVKSKLAKGYSEGETGEVFQSPDLKDRTTGIFPQLLNEIKNDEELQAMIDDDDFVGQEKYDGERRMLNNYGETIGINKKGLTVPLPKAVVDSIEARVTIDNEIVGDTLYAFDILSQEDKCLKSTPYSKRLKLLANLSLGNNIVVVETAVGKEAKEKLLAKLRKENKEGIVFKRKNHKYKEGRPSSGGDVFKYKFYKTATVRVANHTKGKRSVGLEMLDGGVIAVGKVTITPNKDIPAIGSYIEVRYLYAYKGGSLYQPTYLEERLDQDETDINLSQLVYKAE